MARMKSTRLAAAFGLALCGAVGNAWSAEATSSALDVEAKQLVQKVWDANLRTCGRSAFESLGGRVLIELEEPQFHLAPVELTDAAKQSGYQYQTTAIVSARRWRWAHQRGGTLSWTPWQEGANLDVRRDEFGIRREHTLTEDAVLQFDLVRKDGVWKANYPLSPLNSEPHPFDFASAFVTPASVPPCSLITARR